MKVLSVKQPYAELIVSGKKKIELRKWNTNFRGEFLIHASLRPDEEVMKRLGYSSLTTGAIIGKASLAGVKHYASEEEMKNDEKLHLATSAFGDYGFVLENAERMNPIPCRGNLGFWNYPEK